MSKKALMMRANRGELEKARADAGLKVGDLVRKAGLGSTVVSKARNGDPIRRSAAAAIAGALHQPIEKLFTDVNGQALLPGGAE